jgi:hypothetical protein
MARDADDEVLSKLCQYGFKENRIFLLGPWKGEDCLGRAEIGGVLQFTVQTWFDLVQNIVASTILHNDIVQISLITVTMTCVYETKR